ncbi:MAG: glycosyltransferase family 4 protein [Anaerovoracaceae bacterium]|nr:glycosyltransferase family 4 protein [Bacillota bacterium]MDY2670403.1 glycosyltransferase family 4 protein [Anaerovoracaceae bacterium]
MKKILNIISDTNVGGAGRALLTYLKYMDRDEYEAAAVVPRGSLLTERIKALDIQVFEVDVAPDKSYDRASIKTLEKAIKEYKPDVVHTHGSLSGRIAARRCGCAVVYTRHSVFPVSKKISRGPGKLVNKLVNEHYSDRIIAVSPAAVDNLTEGGISEDRIDVVFNGVERLTPASDEAKQKLRAELGIEPGLFTAALLARVIDYKGQLDIVEAAKLLKDRGFDFKFLFAGTGDSAFMKEVQDRIDSLGLHANVLMLGFRKDVSNILSILDVQLNASYGTEATSLSLLEGFSLGVPAVASDYGGNPYVVEDGVNGLVFRTRDVKGLADALEKLMKDRALLASLGTNALAVYDKRFTAQVYAHNVETVYRKAMIVHGDIS